MYGDCCPPFTLPSHHSLCTISTNVLGHWPFCRMFSVIGRSVECSRSLAVLSNVLGHWPFCWLLPFATIVIWATLHPARLYRTAPQGRGALIFSRYAVARVFMWGNGGGSMQARRADEDRIFAPELEKEYIPSCLTRLVPALSIYPLTSPDWSPH
eukprot:4357810-Pyramimonas_sp.AAC.1